MNRTNRMNKQKNETNKTDNAPNCFKCVYFGLTWEARTPRECKLYGFKTASVPSVVFFETTGVKCVGYKRKN